MAVAVVVVIGYFMSSYYYASWPFESLATPFPTPTDEAFYKSIPNPTANWQTYRNEEYGFEVKYPSDHLIYSSLNLENETIVPPTATSTKITITKNDRMIFCCEPLTLTVEVKNKPTEDMGSWVNKEFINSGNSYRVIKGQEGYGEFAGQNAYRIYSTLGIDSPKSIIAFIYADKMFLIRYDDDKMLERILLTFKLVDQFDTSTWQTYRNEEYGFEMKYPSNWYLEQDVNYISWWHSSLYIPKPIFVRSFSNEKGQNEPFFYSYSNQYLDVVISVYTDYRSDICLTAKDTKAPGSVSGYIITDRDFTIDGHRSKLATLVPDNWETTPPVIRDQICIEKNGYMYRFQLGGFGDDYNSWLLKKPIAEQILSTFRFTR